MSKVEKPLPFIEIMQKKTHEVIDLMSQFGAVDEKGRYLHWHELKRRLPSTVDRVAAWGAIKLARNVVLKKLDLHSENGEPFKLFLPDSCQHIIHRVEQLTAQIGARHSSTTHAENSRYLVESLMMEEAISSAQLEGAATTRKVAKEMLESERKPKNDDEQMVLNNYLLMRHSKYTKDEELTVDLICQFHQLATFGVKADEVHPGEVRETDDIFVEGSDGGIAHQPPKAALLSERLSKLCNFANAKHDGQDGRQFIHPIIKAIILHFMIGYEHPFNDGNGRTARCLFYWYMLKSGYWAFEYISISSLLKKAPVQYGESYLYTETDDYDLTYFVTYQMRIIDRAVNGFLEYIEVRRKEFYELMAWLDDTGISKKLNYRQGHLLRKALRNPGRSFSAKEIKHDYDVSEGTARADLEKLASMKVLAKTKDGKCYMYISRSDAAESLKKAKINLGDIIKITNLSGFHIG
ncbi:Fic family protein [Azotobacter chroococcum subsp. isscasi]|uniref:Fic family protein n=1 Tax=Azotobacter chroococcum TaxID=353 RepID=UPI001038B78E|nr:Fic family protein [Azotobacter chroococcum]TBW08546.1 Fic family protein [Azotobacter chroococcum subsp. isscasi]